VLRNADNNWIYELFYAQLLKNSRCTLMNTGFIYKAEKVAGKLRISKRKKEKGK